MITITKEFTDPIEMDNYIRQYLQDYAPAGYNTTIKIELIQDYEMWKINQVSYVIYIRRWESCD